MHQRIPRWKSICWCSLIRKHCIWISTKGTLQFTWVLLSLAFVVKEGECLLSYLWNLCEKKSFYVIPSQREITERGRIFGILKKIEGGSIFKFYSVMTCCVTINAKEGDCWIQLIIVYCLWCYTNVISDISHLPSSVIQQMLKTISTERTRSPKGSW